MYIPTNLSQKTASRGQTLNSGASVTNTMVRVRVRVNGKCLSLSLTSQCAYLSSLWPYYKLFVMEGELNWGGEDERTISRYLLDYLPLPTSPIWKDGETEADETFTQKRSHIRTHAHDSRGCSNARGTCTSRKNEEGQREQTLSAMFMVSVQLQ